MSNLKQALRRKDMPKDAPGFDFRIKPESYHKDLDKTKSRLVKVFSSNGQSARLISLFGETCGYAVAAPVSCAKPSQAEEKSSTGRPLLMCPGL